MQQSYDLASVARKILSASRPKIIKTSDDVPDKDITLMKTLNVISSAFDDEFSPFDFKADYMNSWLNDEDELSDNFDFNLSKINDINQLVDYFMINYNNNNRDEIASIINNILNNEYHLNVCDDYSELAINLKLLLLNLNTIYKIIVNSISNFIKAKYRVFQPASNVDPMVYTLIMNKYKDNDKSSKIYSGLKLFIDDIAYNINEYIFTIIKNKLNGNIFLIDLFDRNHEQNIIELVYKLTNKNKMTFQHDLLHELIS